MTMDLLSAAFLMAGLDNDADRQFALQLYQDYKGLLYKVALRYFAQCPQDVEDAVSDAVVYMCTYLPTIRKVLPERTPAYMMAVIRHACMRRLREKNRARKQLMDADVSDLQDELAADESMEDVVFARINAAALLKSFSDALSERDRELFRMRHIDKMSIQEMAEVLGVKEGAVRTALTRMKQRLVADAERRGERE